MRPYVICNMVQSLDGRLKAEGCPQAFYTEYRRVEEELQADGWMCGRITMEDFIGSQKYEPKPPSRVIPKTDYSAPHQAKCIGMVLDTTGKLVWNINTINQAHIVIALSEQVSSDYLEFLQAQGISYIFCGQKEINLKIALEKIAQRFHTKKILLQGGGKLNGSMLREGLIDEVCVLVCPAIEGTVGSASIFDMHSQRQPAELLKLQSVKKLKSDILLLNYLVLNRQR